LQTPPIAENAPVLLRAAAPIAFRAPLIRLDSFKSKNDLINGQVFCVGRFSVRMQNIDQLSQHLRPKKLNI